MKPRSQPSTICPFSCSTDFDLTVLSTDYVLIPFYFREPLFHFFVRPLELLCSVHIPKYRPLPEGRYVHVVSHPANGWRLS